VGPSQDDDPSLPRVVRFNAAEHDVAPFACGNPSLDAYLHGTVTRDEEHHTAVTFVLVYPALPSRVLGYFTLNTFAFPKRQARRRDRDRHLGSYDPVAAVLIGRLALDRPVQGQGLGSVLLVSALTRILAIQERVGVAVAVVHAIDEAAAAFYEHNGFTRFRDEPLHLYYPLSTFEAGLETKRAES
jgi:GNAT superfamily N-acetyltransferase